MSTCIGPLTTKNAITKQRQIRAVYRYLSLVSQENLDDESDTSHAKLYPFPAHHVKTIYTQRQDGGEGIWFHLADGSIWDSKGYPVSETWN